MSVKLNRATLPLWRHDFRLTLRLALPLIMAEVGWMSMGIVDVIIVGRLPNSAIAIGATGLGQSLYHSIVIFGGGLLLGMDTFVARPFRPRSRRRRHSLVNSILLPSPFANSNAAPLVLAHANPATKNQARTQTQAKERTKS